MDLTMRKQNTGACAILLMALLAGCGSSADPAGEGAAAGPATRAQGMGDTSRTPARPDGVDPGATAPDTIEPGARDAWHRGVTEREHQGRTMPEITAVRLASHDGYDRLVIEFSGGVPGFHIAPSEPPAIQCGSGFEKAVAGDRLYLIRMEPSRAHTEQGESTLRQRSWPVGFSVIREAVLICDFEGQTEIAVGVPAGARYRVMDLSAPDRLVIDFRSD